MYKIDKLLKLDRKLYHTQDLAVLWSISNKNSLYTAIKRYVQKGVLIPVHKGLYATVPLSQIDPVKLGLAVVHNYAYVSCETALAQAGIIFQAMTVITLVSNQSRRFTVGGHDYVVRRLNDKYLYQPAGLGSPERAVADMLYFNPKYHFDGASLVDWDRVKQIQKEVGYGRVS